MKIFITGATGYIGGAVAKELKSRGHKIIALARTEKSANQLNQFGYKSVLGDMLNPDKWKSEVEKAEAIIHCAQLSFGKRISTKWVEQANQADQICLKALIDAGKKGGNCKALIYTSGISVVGDYKNEWTDENTPPKESLTVGSYHLNGEKLIQQAFKDGLPAFSLRPSMPVSSGGTFASFFLSEASKGKLKYVGSGENYCPTVHLSDLAKGYALALEKIPAGETIILSDDSPYTMKDFCTMILNSFGKGKPKSAPKFIVSLFAGKPLANMLVSSYRVRNDKAKKLLGWKPDYPTFKESLKQVIQEYKI